METQVNQNPGSKKRPIIIGLAIIALLAIGATAYAMFIDLSPRELYLKSEMNTFKTLNESVNDNFKDALSLQEKQAKEAYKSEARVSVDMDTEKLGAGGMEAAMIGSILKSSELKFTTQHDPKKEEGQVNMALTVNDADLVKADFYQNNKETALNVPAAYDKRVYFPNAKFGDVMRKFDPAYVGMEKLENFFKAYDGYITSEEERDDLFKEYAKVYADSIKEDNVKLKENVDFKGEKLRQLTVTLSEKETKDLIVNFLKKIESDDKLLDAMAEQASLSGGLPTGTMAPTPGAMSKEETKKELKNSLKEAQKAVKENASFPEGMKQVVLIDSDENVVKRDLKLSAAANGGEVIPMNYASESWTKDDVTNSSWTLNAGPEGQTVLADVKMQSEPKGKGMKRDIKAKFESAENGSTQGIGFHVKGEGTSEKSNWTAELVPAGDMPAQIPQATLEIEHKGDQNLDKDFANHDYKVRLISKDPSLGDLNVGLNIKTKTTFGKKLKFPELAEGKSVNLAEMSDAEMMGLMSEIQRNLQQFMGENASFMQGL
ncbi:DUF6583 family protein [Fictibacillus barbaricus]|uniref:Uncharacterized protein n=1 Tax=Fictibacillus barbaricus TaxID=182136 RepID=A0ABU1U1Q0_9BACL|nr:DUF6583 family protein [Fictibacillus barbaricus]MDR7073405.1 hypothetical protein [Fictibacillus barbaricus]